MGPAHELPAINIQKSLEFAESCLELAVIGFANTDGYHYFPAQLIRQHTA